MIRCQQPPDTWVAQWHTFWACLGAYFAHGAEQRQERKENFDRLFGVGWQERLEEQMKDESPVMWEEDLIEAVAHWEDETT